MPHRYNDTTLPIAAIQLWQFSGSILGQLAPSTLGAVGGADVRPRSGFWRGGAKCVYVCSSDVENLRQTSCQRDYKKGAKSITLLCISIPSLVLLQSRNTCLGKVGELYHLDWKQIVPAAPAFEFLTVSLVGK